MNDKAQLLTTLRQEFERWDELLSGMSEAQATSPLPSDNWSMKDVMAHLWAWQQRTIARLEASLNDREPEFPRWPAELDPEIEAEPDELNAWIYARYRDRPWSSVHEDWRAGFLRLLEMAELIPEGDLLDPARYSWLEGHSLAFILRASCEHHEEHRGWLPPQAHSR